MIDQIPTQVIMVKRIRKIHKQEMLVLSSIPQEPAARSQGTFKGLLIQNYFFFFSAVIQNAPEVNRRALQNQGLWQRDVFPLMFCSPFLSFWQRSDWGRILSRMRHPLVVRTTTVSLVFFSDYSRHWWMFQRAEPYPVKSAPSNGSKTFYRSCTMLLFPPTHSFLFLTPPPSPVSRWAARPWWFSSSTASWQVSSGCWWRASTFTPCWLFPSSLRGSTSGGTSWLAGVRAICPWILIAYSCACVRVVPPHQSSNVD